MAALIPGTRDAIVVGGYTLTQLSKLIQLGGMISGGSTRYSTLRAGGTTAGYVVPASFKLVSKAIRLQVIITTYTSSGVDIGYGDNDVGLNTTTAPTNDEYSTQSGPDFSVCPWEGVSGYTESVVLPAEIAAGKYPVFASSTGGGNTPVLTAQVFYYKEAV